MGAAEAAAAGALAVSASHSGAAEVSRELAAAMPEATRWLVSFDLDHEAVTSIAARINAWVELDADRREAVRAALRETVERLWSWNGVAATVLAASSGELVQLLRPQGD